MTIESIKATTVRIDRFGETHVKTGTLPAFINMACKAIESGKLNQLVSVRAEYDRLEAQGWFESCSIEQDAHIMFVLESLKAFETGKSTAVKEKRELSGAAMKIAEVRKNMSQFARYEFELED
jgi:hypothetical protein